MRLYVVAAFLPVTTAFWVPAKQYTAAVPAQRSIVRPREDVLRRVLSEPTDIRTDYVRLTSDTRLTDDETVASSNAAGASNSAVDVGKAIFLANTRENVGFLEEITQVNAQPDLIDAGNLDAQEATGALTSLDLYSDNASALYSTNDGVGAVLEASELAAAAAESRLRFELAQTDTISLASSEPDETLVAPTVFKIIKFAVPAIGVWLCSPLLSLIDTSAVGILSGTVQQAALNPAVAVTDYTALLIAFMYTGTTNLIAAARVKDKNDPLAPRTKKSLIGVLKLSTFVGFALGAGVLCFASPLLRTLIGNDSISPEVFDAAMKYVQIRALGMPAAAVIGSAQAACLGMQDIKSPLYVLVAAALVNLLGDVLFVGSTHPLIGGAAGAAWATVFSQYAAMGMFIQWLRHKSTKAEATSSSEGSSTLNLSTAILELTAKPSRSNKSRLNRFKNAVKAMKSTGKSHRTSSPLFTRDATIEAPKTEAFSVRGFLHGSLRKRDLIQFPSRDTLQEFAPYVIPVTTTVVGRLSGYVAMSHVVSSSLGTVSMAAQQVVLSLFYCLTPIADSLSLTAQSFLPSLSENQPGPERSRAMRQTVTNFFKAAGLFGAVMVGAVSCVPMLSGFFTTDASVISLVNMVVPLLMAIFSVHGLVCTSEGLLLGRKDLGFLGKMYAGFFGVVPYFMLRVKRAALSDASGRINLTSVWKVFLGYQLFRTVLWIVRLSFLQRQSEKLVAN